MWSQNGEKPLKRAVTITPGAVAPSQGCLEMSSRALWVAGRQRNKRLNGNYNPSGKDLLSPTMDWSQQGILLIQLIKSFFSSC